MKPLRPPLLAALTLLAASLPLSPASAQCPTRSSWPTQGWPDATAEVASLRAEQIKALEDYAFTLTGEDKERKGIRTDGVLIIHRGRVVYERYARGWDASKRHLSWSVSKSFTNALTGIAVKREALKLEDSICKHVRLEGGTSAPACAITVQNLLEFASGLDWLETYEGKGNQASSVLAMLYGEGRKDMVRFIASHPLRDTPGTAWSYSSGDTTLLAGVLDAALKPSVGKDWPWVLLFDVLGMRSAVWERDAKGVVVGSSYLYATPRDLAKLGYLFLNDGCWENEQLFPPNWVADSTNVSEAIRLKSYDRGPDDVQGRQWWLNRRIPEVQETLPFPSVPEGMYAARGHWGQSVSVIPSHELIVVRTADDRQGGAFSLDAFLKLAMGVVEGLP
jgi:CubicO group peptidase (beta-lactamase class C family)